MKTKIDPTTEKILRKAFDAGCFHGSKSSVLVDDVAFADFLLTLEAETPISIITIPHLTEITQEGKS